jgi:hypothetical protein
MSKINILEEIKRTAKTNGGMPLGKQRFFQETGIKESDWSGKFWTKWGDAVQPKFPISPPLAGDGWRI